MPGSTPKHAIPYSLGGDNANTIDDTSQAMAVLLDAKLTPYDAGSRAFRPVSTLGTPGVAGREYRSTDDGGIDRDYGTGWVTVRPALLAALPVMPDGDQIVDFQTAAMAAKGLVWTFRYRAAGGTYKWEFTGGAAWREDGWKDTAHTVPYVANSTSAPVDLSPARQVGLPLSGEYEVWWSGRLYPTTGTITQEGFLIPMGTEAYAASDSVLVGWSSTGVAPGWFPYPQSNTKVCTVAAGGAIRLRGGAPNSPSWAATRVAMSIRPIRVG